VSGTLDRHRHRPLVASARAELSSRLDLAALGEVPSQVGNVLVVDRLDALGAEHADLAPGRETAAAAPAASTSALIVAAAVAAAVTATTTTVAGALGAAAESGPVRSLASTAAAPRVRSRRAGPAPIVSLFDHPSLSSGVRCDLESLGVSSGGRPFRSRLFCG